MVGLFIILFYVIILPITLTMLSKAFIDTIFYMIKHKYYEEMSFFRRKPKRKILIHVLNNLASFIYMRYFIAFIVENVAKNSEVCLPIIGIITLTLPTICVSVLALNLIIYYFYSNGDCGFHLLINYTKSIFQKKD